MIETYSKCWNSLSKRVVRRSGDTSAMESKLKSTDCYFNRVKPLRKESDSKVLVALWCKTKGKLWKQKIQNVAMNDETVPNKHFNQTRAIPWVPIRRITALGLFTLCITLPQKGVFITYWSKRDCDETWQSCVDSGLTAWLSSAARCVCAKYQEKRLAAAGRRWLQQSWTGLNFKKMTDWNGIQKRNEKRCLWQWLSLAAVPQRLSSKLNEKRLVF